MPLAFSRRSFLTATAAQVTAFAAARAGVRPTADKSTVSLVKGEDRRKNVYNALMAIDDELRPKLKLKKYVIIKPNNVSTVNPLASTSADTLRGFLDYLAPRFKGPIMIAESSAGETMQGFENFKYNQVRDENKAQKVSLLDFNTEGKFKEVSLIDFDLHVTKARLAARLFDPDAFVFCSAILKTHNTVVATLSVKNMTLGAPIHQAPGAKEKWNDKRKYHVGVRQTHYNMLLTAQALRPYWGATVIDGFEGMEGNGPASGSPVPSRIAIASTDLVAADRIGVEAMGIDPKWVGYLNYCGEIGVGNYDLAKIEIRGEKLASVVKKYTLHKDMERELQWMGPMTDLPPKLG